MYVLVSGATNKKTLFYDFRRRSRITRQSSFEIETSILLLLAMRGLNSFVFRVSIDIKRQNVEAKIRTMKTNVGAFR